MNHNLEGEGTDKGTTESNPYHRYGAYAASKLVGMRPYWASQHCSEPGAWKSRPIHYLGNE